ncbi:hypothetical protein [Aquabacterium sp.]|uniref:hypothetical protein n=1 Tax=Aquabacterium sp. TaxID=1872578 RepID=UPI002E305D8D|nr:hypothetical protein [Aquabacterium sp.]HEX5310208.1 hypothetical protein [Aquabacterium sp.]
MFGRLFALWSLVSLLLASGPAFAGLTSTALYSTESTLIASLGSESTAPSTPAESGNEAPESITSSSSSSAEVESSTPDPMDWPEGIELLPNAPSLVVLSQSAQPNVWLGLPDPCLGSLQRPPCSLS